MADINTAIGGPANPDWDAASKDYAREEATVDKSFAQESVNVAGKSQIDTYQASKSSYEKLFGLYEIPSYADFSAPPEFNRMRGRLYTWSLVPSIGTGAQLQEMRLLVQTSGENKENMATEQNRDQEVLSTFLDRLCHLSNILDEINTRRTQYQKG